MWQGSRGREDILGFFWTKADICDFVLVTATAVELYARVTQVSTHECHVRLHYVSLLLLNVCTAPVVAAPATSAHSSSTLAQGLSLQDVRRHDVTEPPLYSHATRVLLLRNGSWFQAREPSCCTSAKVTYELRPDCVCTASAGTLEPAARLLFLVRLRLDCTRTWKDKSNIQACSECQSPSIEFNAGMMA